MEENKLYKLELKLDLAAQAYLQEFHLKNGKQDNEIVWMRNDATGEMLCLTKGKYTDKLSSFIQKLH